jgi:hypothetical protein
MSFYRKDLDPLGWVQLDARAQEAAGKALCEKTIDDATRVALFLWIRDAPSELRRSVANTATQTLLRRSKEDPDALSFAENSHLLLLVERLVEDLQDEEIINQLQTLRDR